jgi:hypothetical protein
MTFRPGHALRGIIVACLVAAGTTLATVPAAADVDGVGLTLTPGSVGTVGPGGDLLLSLTVTNTTGEPLAAGEADVVLDRGRVGDREELERWYADDSTEEPDGATIATVPLAPEQLQPGANRIDITVPAADVGLSPDPASWGVHEIAVEASAGSDDLGVARSTIVWNPGQPYQPTGVAVVSSITVPDNAEGVIDAESLETYTSPTGLLTRQLDAVDGEPVAVAIDPMIIASIRVLGVSAPQSAVDWLDRLDSLANETFPLGYADADLTVANQSGVPMLPTVSSFEFTIDPADFPADAAEPSDTEEPIDPANPSASPSASPTPEPAPDPAPEESTVPTLEELLEWEWTRTDIAWPVENTVLPGDLDFLRDNGYTTTMIASGNVDVVGQQNRTAAASALANGTGVAVADQPVSALFREASAAPTEAEWGRLTAQLAATLAVITAEDPDSARTLLATGTREASAGIRFGDTVAALGALPWADTASLGTATSAPPADASVRTDRSNSRERLGAVAELARDVQSLDAFSVVAEDRAGLTGGPRARYAALLSPAWLDNATGWDAARAEFRGDVAGQIGAITVPASSTVNFYSYGAPLPISVSNALNQSVTVTVQVTSSNAILQVDEPVSQLTIEPNSSARLQVPVTSVASGSATITVRILGPAGEEIAPPSVVTVNVQAEWESVGTGVLAGLVVLVFAAGIVRTVLKRRGARAAHDEHADDVSRETNGATDAAGGAAPASVDAPGAVEDPPAGSPSAENEPLDIDWKDQRG